MNCRSWGPPSIAAFSANVSCCLPLDLSWKWNLFLTIFAYPDPFWIWLTICKLPAIGLLHSASIPPS